MDKKIVLLIIATICVVLYFFGSQIQKDSEYLKFLPTIGGLAFGLNTLVQFAH